MAANLACAAVIANVPGVTSSHNYHESVERTTHGFQVGFALFLQCHSFFLESISNRDGKEGCAWKGCVSSAISERRPFDRKPPAEILRDHGRDLLLITRFFICKLTIYCPFYLASLLHQLRKRKARVPVSCQFGVAGRRTRGCLHWCQHGQRLS